MCYSKSVRSHPYTDSSNTYDLRITLFELKKKNHETNTACFSRVELTEFSVTSNIFNASNITKKITIKILEIHKAHVSKIHKHKLIVKNTNNLFACAERNACNTLHARVHEVRNE